jgi:hypothetical protein
MIVERLGGCLPSEGLAGSGVEGRGDGVEVILAGRSCGQAPAPEADTNVGVLSAYVGTE